MLADTLLTCVGLFLAGYVTRMIQTAYRSWRRPDKPRYRSI